MIKDFPTIPTDEALAYALADANACKKDEKWNGERSTGVHYDRFFKQVLGAQGIKDLIEQGRKDNPGENQMMLDVMSYTAALNSLPIDGGVAIALNDPRWRIVRRTEAMFRNIKLIEGNVLDDKPWQESDEWLKKQSVPGYRVVVIRPRDGKRSIPHDFSIYGEIAQHAWKSLHPNGGTLLAELPSRLTEEGGIVRWIERLNRHEIGAQYAGLDSGTYPIMRLHKTVNSPATLPVGPFPKGAFSHSFLSAKLNSLRENSN